MKRALIAFGLVAFVAVAALSAEASKYYPVRLDVVKIFSHADGYRVVYRKGTASVAELFIPIKWFVAGGKGELIRGNDPSFPYMVIYYNEGKFSHVRLYAQADQRDGTWGILPPADGKGKFDNIQELKPEF